MKKPASLRDHLLASVPLLKRSPDQVKVFLESGSLRTTAGPGLSFQYSYQLSLLITDYTGSPDHITIPLLDWVRVNQNELLANQNKHAESIKFEAEFLDLERTDLQFTLPLTERVIVKRVDGKLHYRYPPEPALIDPEPAGLVQLMLKDEVIAEWHSGEATGADIATPIPSRRPCDCDC